MDCFHFVAWAAVQTWHLIFHLLNYLKRMGRLWRPRLGIRLRLVLNIAIIKKTLQYKSKMVFRRIILIGMLNFVMFIAVVLRH